MIALWRGTVLATGCAMLIAAVSCSDETTTPTSAGSTLSQTDLMGTWRLTKVAESWDYVEGGVRDQGTDGTDIIGFERILSIDAFTTVIYDTAIGCLWAWESDYQLSGSTLLGEDWAEYYDDTADGYIEQLTTTVSFSGTTLSTARLWTMTGSVAGWHKYVYTYEPYNGLVPPIGWPITLCGSFKEKAGFQAGVPRHRAL